MSSKFKLMPLILAFYLCSAMKTSAAESDANLLDRPLGTLMKIVLDDAVGGNSAIEGQQVKAHITEDVLEKGSIVIPKGSEVYGEVVGTTKKPGMVWYHLLFRQLVFANRKVDIWAIPCVKASDLHVERRCGTILIGALYQAMHYENGDEEPSTLLVGTPKSGPSLEVGDEFSLIVAQDPRVAKEKMPKPSK